MVCCSLALAIPSKVRSSSQAQGTGNNEFRASFASLADSSTANGRIVFSTNYATRADGSQFEYTGTTDLLLANRQIELASALGSPTFGHQLRSAGAGTLSISTDLIVSTPIAQTLHLNGTNTGANTFSGKIIDGDGKVSLTKSEAGRWILSGANTYTGNTTVTGGTLELADNAQLKFVLGSTSGTNNSITGTAGTTVTLDGDFVIDTSAADALASGTWTLENVSTLAGPYGSNFTVVGFVNAGSDKWTKVNGAKTYTFDETTGILTLAATVGGGVTFADWRTANGAGSQTLADDHDNDGVDNGTEFFLGGDTDTTGFTPLPGVVNTGGILSVTWVRHPNYPGFPGNYGTDFVVQTSTTLVGPWTTEDVPPTPGANVAISGNNVTYTFPGGPAYTGKRFARLKVTGPN